MAIVFDISDDFNYLKDNPEPYEIAEAGRLLQQWGGDVAKKNLKACNWD